MKQIGYFIVLMSLWLLTGLHHAVAQEFFSGTKSTTATISRSGITNLGFSQFRNNPANTATVLEHIHPVGDLYIRSMASRADSSGNVIINDNGGFVGIGTTRPREQLSVNGNVRAREIKVETVNWPDYVFEDGYELRSLKETEEFIRTHKHLPNIPSAGEVEQEGIALGQMNRLLLEKIEELTLHLIEKEKRIEKIERELSEIKNRK